MTTIHVLVAGVGLVGSALLAQINKQAAALATSRGITVRIVGVANSRTQLWEPVQGIDLDSWAESLKAGQPANLEALISEFVSVSLTHKVLVDTTATESIVPFYHTALKGGINVVACNKKASSGSQAEYDALQALTSAYGGPRLFLEANVGAGLPVIGPLKSLVGTGDKIRRVEAVLSGTLSYIFNTFDKDHPFSTVVIDAKAKGYTEPDPRDDLSGGDVARKLLILARIAGLKLEIGDVEIEPLVSSGVFAAATVDDFLAQLPSQDADYEQRRAEAEREGKKLRYIAALDTETQKASIQLMAVDSTHAAYSLQGSANVVVIITERYSAANPLVVKGPGAGAEVTAAGVFGDILLSAGASQ